ncbi:MAG: hypothetical protein AVDCRST_MAG08-300, partial [uncultured Acetobacteraceae bacterium]
GEGLSHGAGGGRRRGRPAGLRPLVRGRAPVRRRGALRGGARLALLEPDRPRRALRVLRVRRSRAGAGGPGFAGTPGVGRRVRPGLGTARDADARRTRGGGHGGAQSCL